MMQNRIIAVIGGARSGKSTFAEELAKKMQRPTLYIATAQNRDAEMADRIAKHRASRPSTWQTVEAPLDLETAILESGDQAEVLLVDCLTLYISNLLLERLGDLSDQDDPRIPPEEEQVILEKVKSVLKAAKRVSGTIIFVSNEVGWGIVPLYHSARAYRDVVGRANQLLAAAADRVYFVQAGMALELKALAVSVDHVCTELDHWR